MTPMKEPCDCCGIRADDVDGLRAENERLKAELATRAPEAQPEPERLPPIQCGTFVSPPTYSSEEITRQQELLAAAKTERCARIAESYGHENVPDWVAPAYVADRREQYSPSSATYEALSQVMGGLARGTHVEAWKHGELDDLKKDIERIRKEP